MTYYLIDQHIYVPGTNNNLRAQFLPFHRKVKAYETWDPGHHHYWDIFTYHSAP